MSTFPWAEVQGRIKFQGYKYPWPGATTSSIPQQLWQDIFPRSKISSPSNCTTSCPKQIKNDYF